MRPVDAGFGRELGVLERAAEHLPGLFGVRREQVALARVERRVRRVAREFDADGGSGPLAAAGVRVQTERDQVVAERRIVDRLLEDLVFLELVRVGHRHRHRGPRAEPPAAPSPELPRHRHAPAVGVEREGRLVAVPRLRAHSHRVAGSKKVRLLEVEAHAAVERRVAREGAERPRAAQEVDVAPVHLGPGPLLGAVADAVVDLPVLVFRHRHPRRDLHRLAFAADRFDVGEREQLLAVELALTVLQGALPEHPSRTIRQLPPDHVVADALVAADLDGTEIGERARLRPQGDDALTLGAARRFAEAHGRVRVAGISELVERRLPVGLHERAIERGARLERKLGFERRAPRRGQRVEPFEHDALDAHRLPFFDVDGDADGGLRVVQLRVERRDPRVREAAVLVERHDALQIRLELLAAEIALRSPGNPGACRCRQDGFQLVFGDRLGAMELEARDLDAAFLVAGGGRDAEEAQEHRADGNAAKHK